MIGMNVTIGCSFCCCGDEVKVIKCSDGLLKYIGALPSWAGRGKTFPDVRFRNEGHRKRILVIALDNYFTGRKRNVERWIGHPNFELVHHDVEKNDYHHNGQLLMLKNRVENMERERERLAAHTRDQLIAKEKHHAAEINEKEERIRQLETQIQCLRQENLQCSFQVHNVTMSGSVDVEMASGSAAPIAAAGLPTRRVSLPRNDVAWKNISRFGAAASVFANNSTVDRFGNENGSETFAHIPSQMLGLPIPVSSDSSRCPQPVYSAAPKKTAAITESKQCQADGLSDNWNVHCKMREASLESLLGFATASEGDDFDISALSRGAREPVADETLDRPRNSTVAGWDISRRSLKGVHRHRLCRMCKMDCERGYYKLDPEAGEWTPIYYELTTK
ncbi:hypothetical protein TELCIR_15078 [Teladorsagia circumcincta]|uniref:Uncharacterized protein n=1 Tax=Teladorsagia circumcincta TaxID=45464 RepID=A0A2G9U0U4_TELCI|nr:hypothetical protein TELCIR_15078 [Teladorsagia circumcincta]